MKSILASAHLRHSFAAAALLVLTSPAVFAQAPVAPATTPAVGATTTAPGGAAAADKPKPLAPADKKFIKDAGKSIFYELELAAAAKTGATEEGTKKFGELVKQLAPIVGGSGGGRPDFAEAGGKDSAKLADAFAEGKRLVEALLG